MSDPIDRAKAALGNARDLLRQGAQLSTRTGNRLTELHQAGEQIAATVQAAASLMVQAGSAYEPRAGDVAAGVGVLVGNLHAALSQVGVEFGHLERALAEAQTYVEQRIGELP